MRNLVISITAALALVALPAHADRGYGRGGYSHHHRGGGVSPGVGLAVFGALAGLAIMAERNRPVYVDPYPAQAVYPAPLTYAAPPGYSAPARYAAENWYYCQSSAMYYPYTKACPEGWQAVAARPY